MILPPSVSVVREFSWHTVITCHMCTE
jgi:hypothetical protein